MAGVYTDQRLNLSKLGKAFGRKPRFQTGPGKSGCPGLQGGFGKRKPWWDCEPVLQSKEQERKPLTYSGARTISIPVGQVTDVGSEPTGNRRSSNSRRKAAAFVRWHEPDDARVSSPDL